MSTQPWMYDVHGLLKPKFRGLIHLWAIAPMLVAGSILLAIADGFGTKLAVGIYTIGITGMLTTSATYHRAHVQDRTRVWLRRLDHAMIGVAVAATYTPVVLLVTNGALSFTLLSLLWVGAFGAIITSLAFPAAPRVLRSLIYIVLGWGGAVIMPWMWTHGGVWAFSFAVLGALLYSTGAVVYALKRPNPWPSVFGFHEVFHSLVLLAVLSHFACVALVVHNAG